MNEKEFIDQIIIGDKRMEGERRDGDRERRKKAGSPPEDAGVVDRRLGMDRRRGPGRRRTEERKSAEEGNMSDEQFEFLMAIDEYKRQNARPFPSWTEVLEVITALGYRKVAERQALKSFKKEDAFEVMQN
jgi:hypothetical protein